MERFRIGDEIHFDLSTEVEPYSAILVGQTITSIGSFSYALGIPIVEPLKIGRYCSIAGGMRIMPGNHAVDFVTTSPFFDKAFSIFAQAMKEDNLSNFIRYPSRFISPSRDAPPIIENDVWIGEHVTLARRIKLGTGCVIAAGSVVTKDVPPYAIVGGNPARVIRMRFDENIVAALLASEWWKYKFTDFSNMRYDIPELFVEQLSQRVANREIAEFAPAPLRLADYIS